MSDTLLSPFLDRPITCPACGKSALQPHFRLRLFLPGKKESDGHILEYKWMAEGTRSVHPPYFFISLCPHCNFANIQEEYDAPSENRLTPSLIRAFKSAPAEKRAIIEFLAHHTNYPDNDFQTAVNLHLLAAYIHMLPPGDAIDWRNAARIILRLAWLFRENNASNVPIVQNVNSTESTEPQDPQEEEVDETHQALEAFEKSFIKMKEDWTALRRVLAQQVLKSRQNGSNDKAPVKNQFVTHQAVLARFIEDADAELGRLKTTIVPLHIAVIPKSESMVDGGFFTFDNYEAFLRQLKVYWPQAPLTEMEAIRLSITYFKEAVSSDPAFDSHRAYTSAINLIIDLLTRCDDLDGAFEMVRGIYKSAADARVKCQQDLQNKQLEPTARERIANQMRRLNESIQSASDMRIKLLDSLVERDRPKIEQILSAHRGNNQEYLMRVLREGGVIPGVISHLHETGFIGKYVK